MSILWATKFFSHYNKKYFVCITNGILLYLKNTENSSYWDEKYDQYKYVLILRIQKNKNEVSTTSSTKFVTMNEGIKKISDTYEDT